METFLNTFEPKALDTWTNSHAPLDNGYDFVVRKARHFKSPLRGFQHEYIVLDIEPHPSRPQPLWSQKLLDIPRAKGRFRGLKFDARDTIGILTDTDIAQLPNNPPTLSWTRSNAPSLRSVLRLINRIHTKIPHYSVFLDSCYVFSAAVFLAIHTMFDGTEGQSAQSITVRRGFLFGVIPTVATWRARWVVQQAIALYNTPQGGKSFFFLQNNNR